ncbi:TatD family hydrolase [Candidatus Woesearchaeota archaeon]|nr:TatD family hydrolase [Candidatus Woesearchaeota archaeon]
MSLFVDAHCHLDHPQFEKDMDAVIRRAKEAGVAAICTAGVHPASNRIALELAKKYPIVKACLGIYPPDALQREMYDAQWKPFDVDEEIEYIRKHKEHVAMIGEVGLDYADLASDKSAQREIFEKMIQLAEKLRKPLVVHSRKAEQECVEMLQSARTKKIIMHCFSGNFQLVKQIIDNGWFLTTPTHVVRAEHFQKIARDTPINQLLTETDAPFLSPIKEQRNEPAHVVVAVRKLAELKGMDIAEVERNIYMNFQQLI